MELLGQEITLDELVKELLKDRAYYTGGSGGVTASGGEPTMQSLFVARLFARLQTEGIHTALDTCGACSYSSIKDILPHTDLVLYDLKLIDQDDHYQLTGQDNQRILTNLNKLADWIKTNQNMPKLWIRTPLIPDMTTKPDNLSGIGAFIREHLDGFVERWELCAFNNLCRDKYRRLGIPWSLNNTPLMSQTELDRCVSYARSSGFDPSRIILTGATQSENAY
jgi:pyruvate formate lyase activating enzyme